ncbi:flagellar basal body-associated FliL family protein [Alphaproteobacteria bacterium]|jgi:flagellar FliL protein|nr:flagellar basal body-associated FliL family protein [Alphaproteobacteria bacterium]MDA9164997.1 flagellar basal body-associated FliL family protein [Alphaproteobacteria bacterium]MDA9807402.1 flagellar basal body-associated FliL family protein [Alphaproteobacteria bacterium]MDA9816701.1 flagellar basal body-associated FliL family protein [Alphaproteobacteria bacterium]MDB2479173.1 flagellar basal body-associated FliL family protein [Alphaproteobacteria bacterium]|tara:strand:- start:12263 stop:12862 length:600 start_codon:yes stop_codon:yes gene_type:complete
MAEEVEEEQKKGGLIKIIIFVVAGIMLIAVGLGIGYFIFGGEPEPDPSAEVNQIIEGKETEKKEKEESAEKKEGEEGEEGIITKNVKEVPEVDAYETTYFEFPGDFTTNLKGSRKFLQVSVGVSTQYDEKVMEVVDSHQLALRSEILSTISDFTEEDISGSDGKKKLSDRLMVVLNKKLETLKEFPGIEDVYFTAFILQ